MPTLIDDNDDSDDKDNSEENADADDRADKPLPSPLPATGLHKLGFRQLRDVEPAHGLTQVRAGSQ